MKKLIFLLALVAFTGFAIAGIPPLQNPGLESGMSGWGTWGSGSGSGSAGYKWTSHWAYVETTGGHTGSNFMNLTTSAQAGYCEWWGWGYNCMWQSDSAKLDDAVPGVSWHKMDVWAKNLDGGGNKVEMKFEWLDASGRKSQDGGLVPPVSYFFDVPNDGQWHYFSHWSQAPALAYGLRPVWGNPAPGGDVGVDDLSYIPEPMSIALLGLGGLFLRRRK